MTERQDSERSRSDTNTRLYAERDRSDEQLLKQLSALGHTAEDVITRARARARVVLEQARQREDYALDADDATTELRTQIARERQTADDALAAEYVHADDVVVDEGAQRRHAIVRLLALERAFTDRILSSERRAADCTVAMRDDVLGVVSHDLRGHLNVALMRSSVIAVKRPDDAALVEDVYAMQRSFAKMAKLLDDMLDLASIESGHLRVARTPTDLVTVVTEATDVQQLAAKARSIQLDLDVRQRPIVVEIDAMQIDRVLMNVLTNALKFTPAGGRIEVSVERQGDDACISVTDSGPGIAPDQLETVFESFQQSGTRREGYGLGLYIARAIVNAHHGRIWAENTPEHGASFRVRLPGRVAARD